MLFRSDAGGFAGKISGGHIQDSNANNFSYIIGQITAGGYVGDLEPGNVANVLGDTGILGGLVDVSDTLASLAEDFVPTIRNSSTTCIPCGGAVRADAASTTQVQRGMAGGYAGHNEGGHIWGNNTKKWKGKEYDGPISTIYDDSPVIPGNNICIADRCYGCIHDFYKICRGIQQFI